MIASAITPSPITPEVVAQAATGIGEPRSCNGTLYWLESRPAEGGRTTLLRLDGDTAAELTPEPHNVRSRIHEYGGAAYLPAGDTVYFVNAGDQNIFAVEAEGTIRQLTHSGPEIRYADLCADPRHDRLIAVTEIHGRATQPVNALAAIAITTGQVSILHREHDFYASPTVSPEGGELLFIAWDHPNMPWDGTQLLRAHLDGPNIGATTLVAGGATVSVQQPSWRDDDSALYLSDATGFWNLYRLDKGGTGIVFREDAEYAGPAWQLGNRDYAILDDRHVIARRQLPGEQTLMLIDLESGSASPLPDSCVEYSHLTTQGNHLYFLGAHADATSELARYDLARLSNRLGSRGHQGASLPVVAGPPLPFDSKWLGRKRHIEYKTRDGQRAFAWLTLPAPGASPVPGGKAPLLVTTHGGPTGAASPVLRLWLQFYASRGWLVADINYRGSTGYGRDYRNALHGSWGETDVTDCVDAVNHLIAEGLVDPARVAIRGGSAGGYTTLRALTTQTVFGAGASHYGIGDLTALADDTHKFESQYLFRLVGSHATMRQRSPIRHLDGFACPVIFFQGSEDRVVPPNQAEAMVAALRAKGMAVAYLKFPGEGHGFRDGANIAKAIGSEYAFFCRVFGLPVDASLPDIEIENL